MNLSVTLFYEEENHDANINVLRMRMKLLTSVVSLTCRSYKEIFCCLICQSCLFIS